MTIRVWGPGSVGLVLGARLARAGEHVQFVGRDPEAVRRIADDGVHFEDLANGEMFRVRADAVTAEQATRDPLAAAPVLLCVRKAQAEIAAAALRRAAPDSFVVCVQNGVGGERLLHSSHPGAIGAVYRQTCTRREPNAAVSVGAGRIVLGGAPRGDVAALAAVLRTAGYDVGQSKDLERDQWLKLSVNLMSAPNALIRRDDHTEPAFVDIKVALLEEARAVLDAADICAESCDGRDRSLDAEIEFQRDALMRGVSARPLPLYNQVWSALTHGGPVEADGYHRTIIELAHLHGVATPMNDAVLQALDRAVREDRGAECWAAREISAG